jgi:hypothetical protein
MVTKNVSNVFSLIKIKNIFQTNEKIGKIAWAIPLMISRAVELFLIDLLNEMVNVAKKKNQKRIKKKHLKYVMKKKKRFGNS